MTLQRCSKREVLAVPEFDVFILGRGGNHLIIRTYSDTVDVLDVGHDRETSRCYLGYYLLGSWDVPYFKGIVLAD